MSPLGSIGGGVAALALADGWEELAVALVALIVREVIAYFTRRK